MNTVCKNGENSKIDDSTKLNTSDKNDTIATIDISFLHPSFRGVIAEHHALSSLSTFRVGGEAAFFIEPFSVQSLLYALELFEKNHSPFFILGGASNLVIADSGIPIPVLSMRSLKHISLEKDTENDCVLRCEAGASISSIIDFCIENGLTGLEQFAGLPGTIGGAVYMNARCYELSISEQLSKVHFIDCSNSADCNEWNDMQQKNTTAIDTKTTIQTYVFNEKDWDYKKSPFQYTYKMHQNSKKLILEVFLRVKKADTKEVSESAAHYIAEREKKGHFRYPSAGSVFKNNRAFGKPSGKIIDEAGLRGLQIGGAQVAPWHGNFIINTGTATAADIYQLVMTVQKSVKEQFGFDLETEIIFTDVLFR